MRIAVASIPERSSWKTGRRLNFGGEGGIAAIPSKKPAVENDGGLVRKV
jgi:hypothetical protein